MESSSKEFPIPQSGGAQDRSAVREPDGLSLDNAPDLLALQQEIETRVSNLLQSQATIDVYSISCLNEQNDLLKQEIVWFEEKIRYWA